LEAKVRITKDLSIPTFLSLLASGVGLVAVVIIFAFQNFQTKSQAEEQQRNVISQQEDMDRNVRELRNDIHRIGERIDQIYFHVRRTK